MYPLPPIVPQEYEDWATMEIMSLKGNTSLFTVRNAMRLPLYVAMVMILNNHQRLRNVLPVTDCGKCSPPEITISNF